MARPSKDLFLQFQEHLNNEQEVREVRRTEHLIKIESTNVSFILR